MDTGVLTTQVDNSVVFQRAHASESSQRGRYVKPMAVLLSLVAHGGIAWAVTYLPNPERATVPRAVEIALFTPPTLIEEPLAASGPQRTHHSVATPAPKPLPEPQPTPQPVVEAPSEAIAENETAVVQPSLVTAPTSSVHLAVAPSLGGAASAARNTAPNASGDGSGISTADYKASLAQIIRRTMRYPEAARRRHISGVVLVELEVDADGRILARRVLKSPHNLLADAALETLQRLLQLPRPPPHLGAPARVVVPLAFELQS